MRTHLYAGWPLLVAALGPAVPAARPDEAILRDGRRLPGTLSRGDKQWQFLPTGKSEALPLAALQSVRLETRSAAPFRAAVVHRVTLRDGEGLTGVLLGLDDRALLLRTAWADKVSLPRAAVAAVTQQPGWALVCAEDFTGGLKAWKIEGKPGHQPGSGLVLTTAGQSAAYTPATPLKEGRATIAFRAADDKGASVLVEAAFQTPAGPRVVAVTVAGRPRYAAVVPGVTGTSTPVPSSAGPHRLTVQFSPSALRVVVDEAVLWHSLKHGPGGPLVRWRLVCRQAEGQRPGCRVAFEDFALHRAVDEPRRPPGDPGQDEVWLLSGDQLFGRLLRADSRAVVLEGRFGQRTLAWSAVRGLFLRRAARPIRPGEAGRVRLWLDNGIDSQLDRLEGTVLSLDERRCRLRHALLGEVVLERGRVSRVQFHPPVKEIRR